MSTIAHEIFFASRWFKSRPPEVQAIFRKYTGKYILLEDKPGMFHLLGVSEDLSGGHEHSLWLSEYEPGADYELAFATRFLVCGKPGCLAKITTEPYPWL